MSKPLQRVGVFARSPADERRFRFRCAPKQTTPQCEGNEHRSICAVRHGTRLVTSAVRWSDCPYHWCAHSAGVSERDGSVPMDLLTIAAMRVNTSSVHVKKARSHRSVFHRRRCTSVPSAARTARESSDNPATRHSSTAVAKRVGICGRVVSTPVEHRSRRMFAASLPARSRARTRLRWFGSWTDRQRYRRRQAYFRPTDTFALDAALVELIDRIVYARFAGVAGADSRFAGQSLYQIFDQGRSASRFKRPERDFDFLE